MSTDSKTTAWAAGWTIFAAVWMWMLGAFHFFAGFAAIAEDEVIVVTPNYFVGLDLTAWGWIHLVLGLLVLVAGFGLFAGATWAQVTGITVVFISMINNFVWLPYQPIWSILMIAAGGFVIWALTMHGDVLAKQRF